MWSKTLCLRRCCVHLTPARAIFHSVNMKKTASDDTSTSTCVIDKSIFRKIMPLMSLKVRKELCTEFLRTFKQFLFSRPRMKRIHEDEDQNYRLVLLREDLSSEEMVKNEIPRELLQKAEEWGAQLKGFSLSLGYEDLSAEEVLRSLLPDVSEVPSSFEQVGHLAHLNLREDVLPYKHIIGQVILDKNPKIETVVNKIGQIETEYRTFPMEVIAGSPKFDVTVRESGATFKFNFKDVYWNSRLGTEHSRMVNAILRAHSKIILKSDQSSLGKRSRNSDDKHLPLVADMMGGVGPFSVPLAKTKIFEVHCNDLNPESYQGMMRNSKLNNCHAPFISCYNMDGRKFITSLLKSKPCLDHILMNLPQSASDFLDVFVGYNKKRNIDDSPEIRYHMPLIHIYAFSKCVETPLAAITDVARRCAGVMQCEPDELGTIFVVDTSPKSSCYISDILASRSFDVRKTLCYGHIVRSVSPNKAMVCLSFRLPVTVAEKEPLI